MERRLAAILAADVVGYSRLMEADEEGTHARLKALREELIDPAVADHNGRIVKLTGDGALVEFPSVVQAVQCAAAIQRGMAARNGDIPEDQRIVFRVGVNLGDVIIEDDDIYGGGVNVAARLESLADPGGILISGTAFDQVEGRLDCGLEFVGEQQVKNIERPVRVYRLLPDQAPSAQVGRRRRRKAPWMWAAAAAGLVLIVAVGVGLWLQPWKSDKEVASAKAEPLRLPSKPSIAVLPFTNLSDDPEQEYFVDGITNDIITDLSKFSTLFVIAANSTFRYKGKAVAVQEVGRDLGVRYVLEGSVQRADDTLRINAQLIDASSGAHVWAERFDRDATDLFATQNEITRNVVGVVYPLAEGRGKLLKAELNRIDRMPTESLEAYDYFLRAMNYFDHQTKEDNLRARQMFEKAIELDPRYARAMAKYTWTYILEYYNGWADSPEDTLGMALNIAKIAIDVDPGESWAHYALASVYLMEKKHDLAINEFQKAYELNPNDASMVTEYGWGLTWAGRADEGLPLIKEAMRLNPYHPDWYITNLADAYFVLRRHEDMVATLERVSDPWSSFYRRQVVGYAHVGRTKEAQAALAKYLELEPQASIEFLSKTLPFKRQEDLNHFLDGLRKAGLPEKSPPPEM